MTCPNNLLTIIEERLASADEEARRLAVRELASFPFERVRPLVLKAMADESWRVRKEGVDIILSAPSEPSLIEELLQMLHSPDNAGLRNSAVEALVRLGSAAAQALVDHAVDPDHDVRKFVLDIMGVIGDPAFVPVLVRGLDDPDANVSAAAAENLGKMGVSSAVPHLLRALEKPDLWRRFTILEALAAVGEPVPVETLAPLASEPLLRKAVFSCLGAVGDAATIPLLMEGLHEKGKNRDAAVTALMRLRARLDAASRARLDTRLSGLADSQVVQDLLAAVPAADQELLKALIQLFGIIGDERCIGALLEGCRDDRLRSHCLQSFRSMGEGGGVSFLRAFTAGGDEERCFIAFLCGEIPFKESSRILKDGLRDPYPPLRSIAAKSAGKAGLVSLIDDVARLVRDSDPETRVKGVEALTLLAPLDRDKVSRIAAPLSADADPETRRLAVMLYGALGDAEKLVLSLKDADPRVRQEGVTGLGRLCLGSCVSVLAGALLDEDTDVRTAAARALGETGSTEAIEPLSAALADVSPWVAAVALKSLARLGESAIPAIKRGLESQSPSVIIAALEALAETGGARACDLIKRGLEHSDEDVVRAAIDLLSALGSCSWTDDYRERLLGHPHWEVRVSFARALVRLTGVAAVPHLKKALESESDDLVTGEFRDIVGRLS